MIVESLVEGLRARSANALSLLRAICAVVAAWQIVTHHHPVWVLVLLVVAAFTEPLDGLCSRLWRQKRRFFKNGKLANEAATGILCGLVPGAILLRSVLARWYHWQDSNSAFLVVVAVACTVFVLGTRVFAKGREQLVEAKAEKAEVHQAWFTGVIYISCVYAIAVPLWVSVSGVFGHHMGGLALLVGGFTVLVSIAAGDRLTERREEWDRHLYKGTKTSWSQVKLFGK
jgi:phosphatidylglycerophosphate synthase